MTVTFWFGPPGCGTPRQSTSGLPNQLHLLNLLLKLTPAVTIIIYHHHCGKALCNPIDKSDIHMSNNNKSVLLILYVFYYLWQVLKKHHIFICSI